MSSHQGSPKKQVTPSVSRRSTLPYMGQSLTNALRLSERVRDQAEAGRCFVCLIFRKSTQILIGGRSSLPPPSPKRSRFAAVGESDVESSPKPVSKTPRTPVQANKGNTPKAAPTTPTPSLLTRASLNALNKSKYVHNPAVLPPFLNAIVHFRRAASPADTADDNESVAESVPGTVRRTEEQRIQYLREQPDCGELEPHRVFCKRCKRWVGMGGKPSYPVYKWTRHIEKCKTKEPACVSVVLQRTVPSNNRSFSANLTRVGTTKGR